MTDDPLHDPIIIDPGRGSAVANWAFRGFVVQCFGVIVLVVTLAFIVLAVRENRRKIDAIMHAVRAEGIEPEAYREPSP